MTTIEALDWVIFHIEHRLKYRKDLFTDDEIRALKAASEDATKDMSYVCPNLRLDNARLRMLLKEAQQAGTPYASDQDAKNALVLENAEYRRVLKYYADPELYRSPDIGIPAPKAEMIALRASRALEPK